MLSEMATMKRKSEKEDKTSDQPLSKKVKSKSDTAVDTAVSTVIMRPWKYMTNVIDNKTSAQYYESFKTLVLDTVKQFGQPKITVFNKQYEQPRVTAYYAVKEETFKYSGAVNISRGWPSILAELTVIGERLIPSGRKLTRALVNYYRDGNDKVGKHSDNDAKKGYIISFSFYPADACVARKFVISKRLANGKFEKVEEILLEQGSVIRMDEGMQENYVHELTATQKVKTGRINVTLRENQG
jgi:alkylated DNA repair dioxygenase AlkB